MDLSSPQFGEKVDGKVCTYSDSKFVILPAPLEETVSYGEGTSLGPKAIINESPQLELWDCEVKRSFPAHEVCVLEPLSFGSDQKNNILLISEAIKKILADKKIPIMLGGEHTVSWGGVMALSEGRKEAGNGSPFTILQFDAHGDLRFEYEGTIYSHACVMRHSLENFDNARLVQVGIRAICEEEEIFMEKNPQRVKTFFAHDKKNWSAKDIVSSISTDDVYITFDVDGFDPSVMPATGTPVPNGLMWQETMEILKEVSLARKIVAMDIVELAPKKGFEYCDFTTSLLVQKMITYSLR